MKSTMLIVIPAYNEEESIGAVIEDLRVHCPDAEIAVVNDGSSDRTAAVARSLGVTVLDLPVNLGIGAAVQTGYRYAHERRHDVAVQFDGDGQHRADQIGNLLQPVSEGKADMVIGSRFLEKGRYRAGAARSFGIKVLSGVISLIVRRRITDPTSGFRVVNRDIIRFCSERYPDDYPEPEAIVVLHRAGFRIAEVPALMDQRQFGSSSITFVRGIYYMIKVLLAVMIDLIRKQ